MENKKVETFQDLVVWQKSHALVQQIYKLTTKYPKKENTSLAQEQREAASIIPINIIIGFKKRGIKTKVHYYRTALTEIETSRYLLILANDLGYVKDDIEEIIEEFDTIERMLKRLIRSITSTSTTPL